MDTEYLEQPLGYSSKSQCDTDTLCSYCWQDEYDSWGMGEYETVCTCERTSKYRSYVICKVLINHPARELDTTTTLKLMIKELKDIYCHQVPDIQNDIIYSF